MLLFLFGLFLRHSARAAPALQDLTPRFDVNALSVSAGDHAGLSWRYAALSPDILVERCLAPKSKLP